MQQENKVLGILAIVFERLLDTNHQLSIFLSVPLSWLLSVSLLTKKKRNFGYNRLCHFLFP